jgi:hypothetical protein
VTTRAIARCGAGTNNIPVSEMTARGIPVFNTPGANANAVKELVIAGLFLSSRDIGGGESLRSMAWLPVLSVVKSSREVSQAKVLVDPMSRPMRQSMERCGRLQKHTDTAASILVPAGISSAVSLCPCVLQEWST